MLNAIRSDESGFTLVELLVVLIILGILAGILLFGVGSFSESATTAKDNENARTCQIARASADADAMNGGTHTVTDFAPGC